jgi:choline dehydrogenase-like flavoprotein
MILPTNQIPAGDLTARVAIVGAGAAGITLALELGRLGHEVILVTGGTRAETAANRDLFTGTSTPPGSHEPLQWHRYRAFGGGTRVWGGRLVQFDPIDFEPRPYVALSRWPIAASEVFSRYPEAARWCETHHENFRAGPSGPGDVPEWLGDGMVDAGTCERWSAPTDFSGHYRDELERTRCIRVLLDCHATEFLLDPSGQRTVAVRCAVRGRPAFEVRADHFILATGGLENARLLLASRSRRPAGLGNDHDMVGRCYQSHLAGIHGAVRFHAARRPDFYRMRKDRHGELFRRRFRLSDEAQRKLEVLNVIGFPLRPRSEDPSHGDPVLSFVALGRMTRYLMRGRTSDLGSVPGHLANLALGGPRGWASIASQSAARLGRRRLPFLLPCTPSAQDSFFFQGEQAPNRESRVVLDEARDEFGVPRLDVRIRFLDIDRRTVLEFYRVLDESLRASGLGFMEYRPEELAAYVDEKTRAFDTAAHYLGTTRMSDDPREGVVDADLKVHSLPNLFVVGASVFPTGSHANPTMTILALALRLAEHFRTRVLSPARVG